MEKLAGRRVKNVLTAGISWFNHFRKKVDSVNVFPVADGDTGKNMYHALKSAQQEIIKTKGNNAAEVAQAAARGALLGGRGCSGMILSGFFAGFAEGVGECQTLSAKDLAQAFQIGCLRARERIDYPVEGTILSVGEAAAQSAVLEAGKSDSLVEVMASAWQGAKSALQKTPAQLKVLQDNQVVDAGGLGLVYFLEGMVRFNNGQALDAASIPDADSFFQALVPISSPVVTANKFCTEFIVTGIELTHDKLQHLLQSMGEELMLASVEKETFKVHIHAKNAELIFDKVSTLGAISWRKVDDMEMQHNHAFKSEATNEHEGKQGIKDLKTKIGVSNL